MTLIVSDNTTRDIETRLGNWHDVVDGNGNGSLIAQMRVLNGNLGNGDVPAWPNEQARSLRNRLGNWNDVVDLHGNGSFSAQAKKLIQVFAGLAGISDQMTTLTTLVNTFNTRITAQETHSGVVDAEITAIQGQNTTTIAALIAVNATLVSLQNQINAILVLRAFQQKNTNTTIDYTIQVGDDTVRYNCTTAGAIVRIIPGTAPMQSTKVVKGAGGNPITVVNVAAPTAPNAGNTLAVINDANVPKSFQDMGVGNAIQINY